MLDICFLENTAVDNAMINRGTDVDLVDFINPDDV